MSPWDSPIVIPHFAPEAREALGGLTRIVSRECKEVINTGKPFVVDRVKEQMIPFLEGGVDKLITSEAFKDFNTGIDELLSSIDAAQEVPTQE